MLSLIITLIVLGFAYPAWYAFDRFAIPYALITLGERDAWYSPVRVKPESGTYAVMTKFTLKKRGVFDHFIHSVEGHYIDDEHDFVEGDDPHPKSLFAQRYGDKYGVVWVGFFKRYLVRRTEYAAVDKSASSTEYKPVSKTRNESDEDPYYFFKYSSMLAHAKAAEIVGKAAVDGDTLFATIHRNPYKVHYYAGKWPVRATTTVERCFREFVQRKTYDEVLLERESGGDNFAAYLKANSDSLNVDFGMEIANSELYSIELVGSPELRSSYQLKQIEKNKADATEETKRGMVTLAEGKRAAREAEAEGIKAEFAARMSVAQGDSLSWAEAVRVSQPSTLMLGNGTVAVPPAGPRSNSPSTPGA